MKELGKRLRDSAKKAGLSYSEIEEKLSLEEGTYQLWVSSLGRAYVSFAC